MVSTNTKKVIRGKAPGATPRVGGDAPVVPTIRGGNRDRGQIIAGKAAPTTGKISPSN